MMGLPVTSFQALATDACVAMPPLIAKASCEKSTAAKSWREASALASVLTTTIMVIRAFLIAFTKAGRSRGFAMRIWQPPILATNRQQAVSARMW